MAHIARFHVCVVCGLISCFLSTCSIPGSHHTNMYRNIHTNFCTPLSWPQAGFYAGLDQLELCFHMVFIAVYLSMSAILTRNLFRCRLQRTGTVRSVWLRGSLVNTAHTSICVCSEAVANGSSDFENVSGSGQTVGSQIFLGADGTQGLAVIGLCRMHHKHQMMMPAQWCLYILTGTNH